jgi:hypothetical protein
LIGWKCVASGQEKPVPLGDEPSLLLLVLDRSADVDLETENDDTGLRHSLSKRV